jgi:hypothetical protein
MTTVFNCPLCGAGWVKCDDCHARYFAGDYLTCPKDQGVLACIGCDSAVVPGDDDEQGVLKDGVVHPWRAR